LEAAGEDEGPGSDGLLVDEELQCPVEMFPDLDAFVGIGAFSGSGKELVVPGLTWGGSPRDRVVLADDPLVLEAEGGAEVEGRWESPEGGPFGRGLDSEARVEASDKAGKERIRLLEGADPGEAQLRDQAALEGAPEAFDPSLGLGRVGSHDLDAELLHRPAKLGGFALTGELLSDRLPLGGAEDGVLIAIEGDGEAVCADKVLEEEKVAER